MFMFEVYKFTTIPRKRVGFEFLPAALRAAQAVGI